MSSPQIPWSDIEAGLAQIAPAVLPLLAEHLTGLGFDLGPMTPDVAASMRAVDREVDAELAKRAAVEATVAAEVYDAVPDTLPPPAGTP